VSLVHRMTPRGGVNTVKQARLLKSQVMTCRQGKGCAVALIATVTHTTDSSKGVSLGQLRKSDLQVRAEALAGRFRESGRKPVVLEFAGVPKAGKTTTLSQLHAFLKRCGFRVETVIERASLCPIRDKKHSNFNVWTSCATLAQLLEKTQTPPRPDDPDVLILDRGLFDSLCWLTMMERLSRLRSDDLSIMEQFLLIGEWRKRITSVFVMTASPDDSLDREKGYLPVAGSAGSIMNKEVLEQTLATTLEIATRLDGYFPIHIVDTSSPQLKGEPRKTAELVANLALDAIDSLLREEVLHLPRSVVQSCFLDSCCVKGARADALASLFGTDGRFLPRNQVEKDEESVQALPAVVVRNKSGEVLRLRRKETHAANPLDKKLVVWAGGHVRVEDGDTGDALVQCAIRELHEELRLSIEPEELTFLGAIYTPTGERSGKHVAMVYEWRATTDDVAVALTNAEFFERRGNALSGTFVSVDEVVTDISKKKGVEEWSVEIAREFLAPSNPAFPARLL
jgi:predicted NUDIX family phosphoesterase